MLSDHVGAPCKILKVNLLCIAIRIATLQQNIMLKLTVLTSPGKDYPARIAAAFFKQSRKNNVTCILSALNTLAYSAPIVA